MSIYANLLKKMINLNMLKDCTMSIHTKMTQADLTWEHLLIKTQTKSIRHNWRNISKCWNNWMMNKVMKCQNSKQQGYQKQMMNVMMNNSDYSMKKSIKIMIYQNWELRETQMKEIIQTKIKKNKESTWRDCMMSISMNTKSLKMKV
jgi:hypothetical protein